MKNERVARTRQDVRDALQSQVSLLVMLAEQYDSGHKVAALSMSAGLRLLIHQTNTKFPCLLEQLGLRRGLFYSVAPKRIDPGNLTTQCGLLAVNISSDGMGQHTAEYAAKTDQLTLKNRLPFAEWWAGAPVLRGVGPEWRHGGAIDNIYMTRRDIVTAVADTDGGAHVDPGLGPVYASFRSGDLLHWEIHPERGLQFPILDKDLPRPLDDGRKKKFVNSPQFACVRSIAHELLLTLQKQAPWAFTRPYMSAG